MRCSYSTLVKAKRAGRATSVRVQPTGTAVTDYQIPLGQRYSLKDAGVLGLPSWSDRATQPETWVKVPRLSATCPRRVVAFDGGKGNIDRTFEIGDEFDAALDTTTKWTVVGSGIAVSDGLVISTWPGSGLSFIDTKRTFGEGYALRERVKADHAGSVSQSELIAWSNNVDYEINAYLAAPANSNLEIYYGSTSATAFTAPTAGAFHIVELARLALASIRIDGGAATTNATGYNTAKMTCARPVRSGAASGAKITCDWMAIRKYVASEPLTGTVTPTATNRALSRPLNHAGLMRACCT